MEALAVPHVLEPAVANTRGVAANPAATRSMLATIRRPPRTGFPPRAIARPPRRQAFASGGDHRRNHTRYNFIRSSSRHLTAEPAPGRWRFACLCVANLV